MNLSLNIDKIAFDKFLSIEQSKLKKKELLRIESKLQSCMSLKNALETSINNMIVGNKQKSEIRFNQEIFVNLTECGLDKDIKELKKIVREKTGFMLKYSIEHYPSYPPICETEYKIKILLKPEVSYENLYFIGKK